MPTTPTRIADNSEKYQLIIEKGYRSLLISRVQSIDFSANKQTENEQEIGNNEIIGTTQGILDPSVTWEQNDVSLDTELILAGRPIDATHVSIRQLMFDNNVIAHRIKKDNTDTVIEEDKINDCVVSNLNWNINATGKITKTCTLKGADFVTLTSGMVSWGSLDTVSPASISGKNVVVYIGGETESDIVHRVQTVAIQVTREVIRVDECGNRSLVGQVPVTIPRITINFDIVDADNEPENLLLNNLNYNLARSRSMYIKLYDANDAEHATILKSYQLDNIVLLDTAKEVRIRRLAGKRFSAIVSATDTLNSGGMLIFDGDVVTVIYGTWDVLGVYNWYRYTGFTWDQLLLSEGDILDNPVGSWGRMMRYQWNQIDDHNWQDLALLDGVA